MATKKQSGPGRPQKYPLTANQEKSIRSRIAKGETSASIVSALGVHEYAVLRVRRSMNSEG
jgi:hypothetical protein